MTSQPDKRRSGPRTKWIALLVLLSVAVGFYATIMIKIIKFGA